MNSINNGWDSTKQAETPFDNFKKCNSHVTMIVHTFGSDF